MPTITKEHLTKHLFKSLGISKKDANTIIDLFFDQIREALVNEHDVRLSGFGNFYWRDKRARMGRNPRTGEDVLISARRVVTFKAGQKLKDKVIAA